VKHWVTISAIIGLAASIFFSIIGYRIEKLPVGIYFGILIFSITLLFIFFYFEFHNLIMGVRQLLGGTTHRYNSIREIFAQSRNRRVSLYITSLADMAEFVSLKTSMSLPLSIVDVYASTSDYDFDKLSDQQLSALPDRFHDLYLTSVRFPFNFLIAPVDGDRNVVFLSPAGSLSFSDNWMYAPADMGHAAILEILNDKISRRSISLRRLKCPRWLLHQYCEFEGFHRSVLENLGKGRIYSTSPSQIYAQQNMLSRGAGTVLALDMTEVEEWLDRKGLGGVLEENIKSGKLGGADIRRIFFCRSRAFMIENPRYRNAIAEVIRAHADNRLGVGLIYQEDVENPKLIHDSVIYDDKVVWVETVPTTRFSGEGYFSTDRAEINQWKAAFERLWAGDFTASPQEEARQFLRGLDEAQA